MLLKAIMSHHHIVDAAVSDVTVSCFHTVLYKYNPI